MSAPQIPPIEDEDYDSAADSDFNALGSPSSEDRSKTITQKGGKKRKQDGDGDIEIGRSDEGIVAQGRRKKRGEGKGKQKGNREEGDEVEEDKEEEGGVGIRVKLRSGRGVKCVSSYRRCWWWTGSGRVYACYCMDKDSVVGLGLC